MKIFVITVFFALGAILVYFSFMRNGDPIDNDQILSEGDLPPVNVEPKISQKDFHNDAEEIENEVKLERKDDVNTVSKPSIVEAKKIKNPIAMEETDDQKRAKKTAQQHLDKMNVDYVGRQVLVEEIDGQFVCKFILPQGMRGGDFIVSVDAVTEKVTDVKIQR